MKEYKDTKNNPQVEKKLNELERELNEYKSEICEMKEEIKIIKNEIDIEIEEYVKIELENEMRKMKEKKDSKKIVKKYGPIFVGIPSIICGAFELEENPSVGLIEIGVGLTTCSYGIYQKSRDLLYKIGEKLYSIENNHKKPPFKKPPFLPKNYFHGKIHKYSTTIFPKRHF